MRARRRPGGQHGSNQEVALAIAAVLIAASTSVQPWPLGASAEGDVSAHAKGALARELEALDADVDPFPRLKLDARRSWALDGGRLINDSIRQVLAMPVTVMVEVKLVGFDGRGSQQLRIGDVDLRSYLHMLQTAMDTVVVEPQLAALSVYPVFKWQVSHDGGQLASTLESALRLEAARLRNQVAGSSRDQPALGSSDSPYLINYNVVDEVIVHDTSRAPDAHLTIYLLNLNLELGKYAYRYDTKPHEAGPLADNEAPGFCPGTHYVSASTVVDYQQARQRPAGGSPRYLWWDMTAGPVSYGPGPRSKGHVYEHSMPHLSAFKGNLLPATLEPQLASLVWSASQHLVWPPLQHARLPFRRRVVVQVIHLHEQLGAHMAGPHDRFSLTMLKESLQSLVGNLQEVEAHETWLPISQCVLCVEAYTSSLKVRSAREESSNVLAAQVLRVLDPAVMHRLVARYLDGIYGYAGVQFEARPEAEHVLPVLVWHIQDSPAHDPLLFTGHRQAVAFADMVLAVSSGSGMFPTSAMCGPHQVLADSVDVTRPVLGALLQAGWGLANTSTFYTPTTGLGSNHMWALTNTPWGWLTSSQAVSAPLALLLLRNLALAQLNATCARLGSLLVGFSRLSRNGRFDMYATGDMKESVVTRVNLALFKATRATMLMSQASYERALKYSLSMEHDLGHLERMASKIARTTRTSLKCHLGPSLASVWWAPVMAGVLWPVAYLLHGRLYRKKLDKMY